MFLLSTPTIGHSVANVCINNCRKVTCGICWEMFPPLTFSCPTFEAEEVLQVWVVFWSLVDPSVDALQQFGSALSIQDVNVFFYTTFKKTQACIKFCIKGKENAFFLICKWCLIFIRQAFWRHLEAAL